MRVLLKNIPKLPDYFRYFFIRRPEFIDRQDFLDEILDALDAHSQTRIIYLSGEGGVGKTRLLEEVGHIIEQKPNSQTLPVRWSGLLDMYHPGYRSVLGIQQLMLDRLDPKIEHFTTYRPLRQAFDRRLAKGISGQTMDRERQELDEKFWTDYQKLTETHRVVLALDTVENLDSESDKIQQIFQIDNRHVAVYDWLLQNIGQCKNSVVLLAGRPRKQFEKELENTLKEQVDRYASMSVDGLEQVHFFKLLDHLLQGIEVDVQDFLNEKAYRNQLYEFTEGYPVRLALIVELMTQISFVEWPSEDEIGDPSAWREKLIPSFFRYDYSHQEQKACLFFILAIARRGVTSALLHFLEPAWSEDEWETLLEEIDGLSLVKVHRSLDTDEYFLHDVLYEEFDRIYRPTELSGWYRTLVDYYSEIQIDYETTDRRCWGQAIVSMLYYQLQLDPWAAFQECYLYYDDVAMRGREAELEVQLYDELLRFTAYTAAQEHINQVKLNTIDSDISTAISQESAIRWLRRYVDTSQYAQAIDIAEKVMVMIPQLCALLPEATKTRQLARLTQSQKAELEALITPPSPLFHAQLLTYYGDALSFGKEDHQHTVAVLTQATDGLKVLKSQLDRSLQWLRSRLLGRAYNAWGYMLRSSGHYGKARHYFEQALSHYSEWDLDERANTLNNLAYLLAILNDFDTARVYASQALRLRRQKGQIYPIGLSYNTRGLIYAIGGDYYDGIRECKRALKQLQEINELRGCGLAHNALGYIYRLYGNTIWQENTPLALTYYQEAEKHLQAALTIFTNQVDESIRLWETYNELGSLYAEWANYTANTSDQQQVVPYQNKSLEKHFSALEIAEKHNLRSQQADTLDDIMKVQISQGDIKGAKENLELCWAMVPTEYHFDGMSRDTADSQGEFYWLICAKAHTQSISLLLQGKTTQIDEEKFSDGCAKAIFCYRSFGFENRYIEQKMEALIQLANYSPAKLRTVIEQAIQRCGMA